MRQGNKALGENELITGFYFYADLLNDTYIDVSFCIDDIFLVEEYENNALIQPLPPTNDDADEE